MKPLVDWDILGSFKYTALCFVLGCHFSQAQNWFDPRANEVQAVFLGLFSPNKPKVAIRTRFSPSDYPSFVHIGYLDLDLQEPIADRFSKNEFSLSESYKEDIVIRDVFPTSATILRLAFAVSARVEWKSPLKIQISLPSDLEGYELLTRELEFRFPSSRVIGDLSEEKTQFSSLVFGEDKILIVGGIDSNGFSLSTVEIFDPKLGLSNLVGQLPIPLVGPGLCLISPNVAYVVGGKTVVGQPTAPSHFSQRIFLIRLNTGEISEYPAPLSKGRFAHTTDCLPNGDILVIGGQILPGDTITSFTPEIELIKTKENTTLLLPPSSWLPVPRHSHRTILDSNGDILYLLGGMNAANFFTTTYLTDIYRFNLSDASLADTGSSLSYGRADFTVLPSGRNEWVFFGGSVFFQNGTRNIDIWSPNQLESSTVDFTEENRMSAAITKYSKDQSILTGGVDLYYKTSKVEIYDHIEKKAFLVSPLLYARSNHRAESISNGILIFGDGMFANKKVELYAKE